MRGRRLVQEAGIPFHIIAVLTRRSLAEPDRLFYFFAAEGIDRVALNLEEIEGVNRHSTRDHGDARTAYVAFLKRWLERIAASGDPPWVRELDRATRQIMRVDERPPPYQQAEPAHPECRRHGRMAAFSPELLGMLRDLAE